MRCPHNTSAAARATWWQDNHCLMQDRTRFGFMGLSMRTPTRRYIEWYRWNATSLAPRWAEGPVARELYTHAPGAEFDFDAYENVNEVAGSPAEAATLSAQLRAAFKFDLRALPSAIIGSSDHRSSIPPRVNDKQ